MRALHTSLLFTLFVFSALGAGAQSNDVMPNRVIVKPIDATAFRHHIAAGMKSLLGVPASAREIGADGVFVVESDVASTSMLLSAFARHDTAFEYVQADPLITRHASVIPEDPEFMYGPSQLWGLHAISAPQAWMRGQGDNEVVVAVLDSGIDPQHEDLVDNLWRAKRGFRISVGGVTVNCSAGDFGYDAIDDDCQPQEREEHGTNVSGIIGARGDNQKGTVGVSWRVSLLPVAFLDGAKTSPATRAAKALEFVRRIKEANLANVRVLNLSWGAHHHSRLVEDELVRLANLGVVIVTSAGNEASDNDYCPVYPAGYESVSTLISVAATRSDGNLARSSNRGKHSVDIAAPGIGIRTTDPGSSYDSPFGTSMAAALVTGAVALLASQCPALTGLELKQLILANADHTATLEPYVARSRFLNVLAASNACIARKVTSGRDADARPERLH